MAVKCFKADKVNRLPLELSNLVHLQQLVPMVPHLVAATDDNRALILQPVGRHFASLPTEYSEKIPVKR